MKQIFFKTLLIALMVSHAACPVWAGNVPPSLFSEEEQESPQQGQNNREEAHQVLSSLSDIEANDGESTRPSTAYFAPYRVTHGQGTFPQPLGDDDERHSPPFFRQAERRSAIELNWRSSQSIIMNLQLGEEFQNENLLTPREFNRANHPRSVVTLTEDHEALYHDSINNTRNSAGSSGYQGGSSCYASFSSLHLSPPPPLPSQTSIRDQRSRNDSSTGSCYVF